MSEDPVTQALKLAATYRGHDGYTSQREKALVTLADEIERLREKVPPCDYALVDDMEEINNPRYGKGLFCTHDLVRSVE